jgi:hypothetical protein
MNFDRVKNLFSKPVQSPIQEASVQPKETRKTDEPKSVRKNPEAVRIKGINQFAFGAAGYVIKGPESGLWNFLVQKYEKDGVFPLTFEDILGPASTDPVYLRSKAIIDYLIEPTQGEKPLLALNKEGKIVPSEHFGILY